MANYTLRSFVGKTFKDKARTKINYESLCLSQGLWENNVKTKN